MSAPTTAGRSRRPRPLLLAAALAALVAALLFASTRHSPAPPPTPPAPVSGGSTTAPGPAARSRPGPPATTEKPGAGASETPAGEPLRDPTASAAPPATGDRGAASAAPAEAPPGEMPPDHPPVAADDGTQVGVQWFGGACFYLHSPGGVAVVTDPFDPKAAGLDPAGIGAHFVTVSSDDPLHGFTAAVHAFQGETKQVVRGTEARRGDLHIIPIEVPSRRGGKVYAYAIEAGALRFAHLGSVGGPLTPQQVKAFGPIDVAMVPVAGEGLSSRQAVEIAKQLNPRIVIPMAHGTPEMRPPASRLPSVQAFVEASPWAFTRLDTDVTMLSKAVLPQTTEIWSLQYGR